MTRLHLWWLWAEAQCARISAPEDADAADRDMETLLRGNMISTQTLIVRRASAAHHPDADHARTSARHLDQRFLDEDPGFERDPSLHRVLDQHPIEVAAEQRHPVHPAAVLAAHARATRTSDDHSANRDSRARDAIADPEPPQDVERARADRVATELVAGEGGAIQQANAAAGAREQERRDRAGRTGARDHDLVTHAMPHR